MMTFLRCATFVVSLANEPDRRAVIAGATATGQGREPAGR